jgi:cell division protein FtsW (lipid II flippase)
VRRLFPIRDQNSKNDRTQSWLMLVAGLVIFSYGLALTLAPAVRYHAGSERYQFQQWIGVAVWGLAFSLLHIQTTHKLPERDPYILPIVALLTGFGLMTIWRLYPNLGIRQTAWIAVSAILIILGLQYPVYLQTLRRYKYIWLILGLILTGLTIFLGTNPLGAGSARWLRMFGIHFQPSEPLKLLLIVYLAGFFTDRLSAYNKKFEALLPTMIIIGIALLLLVFQRDLGTATIFLLIYLAMLFTSQGNKKVLWITPILLITAGLAGYFFIDVVSTRINTWLSPFGDPTGASYQIIQSMVAIAEGNLIGAGPGLGSPGLIPVSVSDFIFAAIGEELGFLGAAAIILLILVFLSRGIKLAITTDNSFHRYLTLGLIFYFGIQSILIIGGNIGMLPLTGVTLPFLSYGGSSLLVSFFGVMILLTISHKTNLSSSVRQIHQPRYAMIGSLLIIVLIIEIVATSLHAFWFNPALVNRPENPRWIIDDRFSERGNILDRNNQVIITNSGDVGNFQRTSNHIPLYPVIGYTHPIFGQTGIEASMFTYLRGNTGYPYSTLFWHDLLYNQPPQGLDVRLTIDLELQKSADELLAGQSGSIILMNANSGEIIAMASSPFFDAAQLQVEWENLIADPNAPLLNRAVQGLYPPGATLFPFIIAAEPNILLQSPEPEIRLQAVISDLDCAIPTEDALTWQTLVANGCLNAQAVIAEAIGTDSLYDLYQELGLFTAPSLHLTVAEPAVPDPSNADVFYRGNDHFLVSPLQMVMAASAITNQGLVPGPRIVNAVQDPSGGWNTLPKLQGNTYVIPVNTANQVNSLLRVGNSPYWQVISVAITENDQPITWFIAGTTTDWQGQPISTVVVLENKAPQIAENIGRALIEQAIRFGSQNP